MNSTVTAVEAGVWSVARAAEWRDRTGWLVGCNYTPRSACNALEMWQVDTFDAATIDQELGWAAGLGFNSVRVFLHDLVWANEGAGFLDRIERFLDIAARHGVGMMPVFFDSVWHPFPRAGRQREPEAGVHNAGWVQSPGVEVLRERERFERLEPYVTAVVERFARDQRIDVWDLWNEPDNPNTSSYGPRDLGPRKAEVVAPLLEMSFAWARAVGADQPLTSAVWLGDWSGDAALKPIERIQLGRSDVVSFHDYNSGEELTKRIGWLRRLGRPMLCTEFMARGQGSTFAGGLPVLAAEGVGAYCWGFVKGRTQTHLPWDSWQKPYVDGEPKPWFHEIFHGDGRAYDEGETAVIRKWTGV